MTVLFPAGENNYGQTSVPAGLGDVETIAAGLYPTDLTLVNEGAPYITEQPISRTIQAGANITFGVAAIGTPTLSFQWTFDGTNMVGSTNSLLILTKCSSR